MHFNNKNGNLIRLKWLNPEEEIIKESRLGENFRILPLPEGEANYFYSTEQKVNFELISNGIKELNRMDLVIKKAKEHNYTIDEY